MQNLNRLKNFVFFERKIFQKINFTNEYRIYIKKVVFEIFVYTNIKI